MTLHVQMLYEVAKHAKAMADAMQAIVDDCAEQLAQRKAAGETDAAMLDEVFGKAAAKAPDGMTPYDGPTPFDEKPDMAPPASAATTPPVPMTPVPPAAFPSSKDPEKTSKTIVELRAFVAERSTPENRAKIKAILTKYGVKKLTELKETQYEAVKNEVAAL